MKKALSITNKYERGFSMVEVILSVALFAMMVTGFAGIYLYGQEATVLSGNRVRAALLAEEGLEAVRNIRDADFSNLSDGTHGLVISGSTWGLSGSSDTTEIFTREITIASVGSDRKNVTVNVTWQQNPQRSGIVSLPTYMTNWQAAAGGPPGGGPPGGGPP